MRCSCAILCALLLLPCCASPRPWSYTPHSRLDDAPLLDKKIAVLPFEERRPDKNNNLFMIYLIPLVPVGPQVLERPEGEFVHIASAQWQTKPSEDFAKAVASELENARIAKETFFTFKASDGDLVCRGELERMYYDGGIISYGLSVFGPMLWVVLPAGYYSNVVRVRLQLIDRETGKTVWKGSYEHSFGSKVVWIYKLGSDFQYDRLLKDVMGHAINDLCVALGGKPRITELAELVPLQANSRTGAE